MVDKDLIAINVDGLTVMIPREQVREVGLEEAQRQAARYIQPTGPMVPTICDICGETFRVPESTTQADEGTRIYQLCPKHGPEECYAFMRKVQETENA